MGLQHSSLIGTGLKPKAEDIEIAELVPNLEDGTLWTKNDAGEVILIGTGQEMPTPIGQNVLINPDLTINQRGITTLPASGEYWYDRWRSTGTGMIQVIEDGNYVPNAVYTYSGDGITTQQIIAPASGHWVTPEVASTTRKLKLELGTEATPFEPRHISEELALCQRYYEYTPSIVGQITRTINTGSKVACSIGYKITKRIVPIITYTTYGADETFKENQTNTDVITVIFTISGSGYVSIGDVKSDAEIY